MLDTVWDWLGATLEELCDVLVILDILLSATNWLRDAASVYCAKRIGFALAPVPTHTNENATKVCRAVCFDWLNILHRFHF